MGDSENESFIGLMANDKAERPNGTGSTYAEPRMCPGPASTPGAIKYGRASGVLPLVFFQFTVIVMKLFR